MSGAKHTPGPWRVASASEFSNGVNVCAGKMFVALVSGSTPDETAQADALLISAAPDLLAALESWMEVVDEGRIATYPEETQERMRKGRAAIAKATGNPAA